MDRFTHSDRSLALNALADPGGGSIHSRPFQSHAVANVDAFLFEACTCRSPTRCCMWTWEKYLKKHEIFKEKFSTRLPKRFQFQEAFAPLTPWPGGLPLDPTGAKLPDPHYRLALLLSPCPPPLSSFLIRHWLNVLKFTIDAGRLFQKTLTTRYKSTHRDRSLFS